MRTLTKIPAALGGLLLGLFLSYTYPANLMAEKTAMKTFLFFPMWEFYEPTLMDYLLATALLLTTGLMVYWVIGGVTDLLLRMRPH